MNLDRRHFLQMGTGFCLASMLSFRSSSEVYATDSNNTTNKSNVKDGIQLKIVPIEIHAGASKPFKAIHISDTHLCFTDQRENERKIKLGVARSRFFSNGEKYLDATLEHAQKHNELFLHTGDLIDFVSASNLETVQKKFQKVPSIFVSSGNHEFSQYVGEAKEDAAYKAQSYDRVQKAYPNHLTFCSKVINGVNFIAFDDVYYNVTNEIFNRFKSEITKGLPIIALCHCPLYTPELLEKTMSQPGAKSAYLVGVPEERMSKYDPYRRVQQKPDTTTLEFISWLKNQTLLKAILCGHLHFNWSGPFSKTATQYVVGANFSGFAYEIAID